MDLQKGQLYAYQVLQYFVMHQQYQMVRVRQKQEDLWLMHPQREDYPIIHITCKENAHLIQENMYLKTAHRAITAVLHKNSTLYVINTHPKAMPYHSEGLTQITIQPNEISDINFQEAFSDLLSYVHDEPNVVEAISQIRQSMENLQREFIRKQRKEMNIFRQIPKTTGIIIGICVVYWFIVLLVSNYLQDPITASILCGAYYKMNIVSMHEYWRFLTAGFLHNDVIHLFVNMLALIYVGIGCEKVFKKAEYITILLTSIVMGNLFVFLTQGNILGLGISGGIFGLLGAYITVLFENGSMRHPVVRNGVFRLLVMNFMISMLPGISMSAHIGGFIAGIFLGIIFVPSKRWKYLKKHVLYSFTALCMILLLCMPKVNVVDPLYVQVDAKLLRTVRLLNLNSYEKVMRSAYLQYYTKEELGL